MFSKISKSIFSKTKTRRMKSENPRTQGGYPYNIFEAHQNP